MTERLCGAHVWRCPSCGYAVAKAIVRNGRGCPRPGCEQADPPHDSTCRNPVKGEAIRCAQHGGKAGQVLAKTQEREQMARAQGALGELVAEMEDQPVPHPLVGLEDTYATAGRFLSALKVLVDELDSPLGLNRFDETVVHPLVALFGDWVDRYARVQKITLDAGLDARREPMTEADVSQLAAVFNEAIAAAGLTSEQQEAFEQHVSSGLRSLAAG